VAVAGSGFPCCVRVVRGIYVIYARCLRVVRGIYVINALCLRVACLCRALALVQKLPIVLLSLLSHQHHHFTSCASKSGLKNPRAGLEISLELEGANAAASIDSGLSSGLESGVWTSCGPTVASHNPSNNLGQLWIPKVTALTFNIITLRTALHSSFDCRARRNIITTVVRTPFRLT